ncbi:hypothetical protein [Ruficoccus sp. ZRK36]|uniref:DUF1281 family ferredoxin-like fold protein n=1 Tax=Ruficoccus sp. ZRK36 TaxID=2866311 RepID=UPI001C73B84C|nr:hypothetical protein [Ruficoccus sp. ZRK36]QYY36274.1 hypothetical protein K0V07_02125 [Ruficoccus sp. ZRK36]
MAEERDINNLITVIGGDDTQRGAALAALEKLVRENWDHVRVEGEKINFNTDWEPPFKELKALSKEHPEVEFKLLADAFTNRHWLCSATIANGKSDEEAISLVDDAFDDLFVQIYGCSYEQWEKAPSEPFGKIFAS